MSYSSEEDARRKRIKQEFCTLYPTTSNTLLMEQFCLPRGTVQRWARELGLRKDPAYVREVQRSSAVGRTLSAQAREKLAAVQRGRTWTKEQREKIAQTRRERGVSRGERHYNWKGGRPWERFKNPEYLAWRRVVLERDGYICQQCGRQCKKYERGLAAHHIKPYAKFPELRYEISNGLTLCRQCHMQLHGKPLTSKQQVPCACGCGTMIDPLDSYGRPRHYVNYHSRRGKKQPASAKQKLRDQRKGKALTPEHRAKIAAGVHSSSKRIGRPPRSPK